MLDGYRFSSHIGVNDDNIAAMAHVDGDRDADILSLDASYGMLHSARNTICEHRFR